MGSESHVFLLAMVQALAMVCHPASLAFSTCNGLIKKPGRFGTVAFEDRFARCRNFDFLWLLGAGVWIAVAWLQPSAARSAAERVVGAAVSGLWIAAFAYRVWIDRVLAPELRAQASAAGGAEGLVTTDAADDLIADMEAPGVSQAPPSSATGRTAAAALLLWAALLFVATGFILGAGTSLAGWTFLMVLVGLYLSAGIMFVDLHFDYWPGSASLDNLKRSVAYYVLIFEYWIHVPVLFGLMAGMMLAPVAFFYGVVPASAAAFGVWTVCCLAFASFFNGALNRQSIVGGRCPLPVAKNVYSARYPFWTHFFAFIHTVMLVCCLAGIAAMNAALAS